MLRSLQQGREDKHRRHLWSLQACTAASADCQSLVTCLCNVSGFEGQARLFVLLGAWRESGEPGFEGMRSRPMSDCSLRRALCRVE